MPHEKLTTLFSKRGAPSSRGTRGEKGSGYGLAIAKAYLDKYGADIRVESIEEKSSPETHGSRFILRLRRAPSKD